MRKMIWKCAAAGAALAGVFLGAAHYAARHPDTVVARCVNGAWGAAFLMSPVAGVVPLVAEQAHPAGPADLTSEEAELAAGSVDCIPAEPVPADEKQGEEPAEPAPAPDAGAVVEVNPGVPAPIIIPEDDPAGKDAVAQEPAPDPTPDGPAGAVNPAAFIMPFGGCEDEEPSPGRCPPRMPYCADSETLPMPGCADDKPIQPPECGNALGDLPGDGCGCWITPGVATVTPTNLRDLPGDDWGCWWQGCAECEGLPMPQAEESEPAEPVCPLRHGCWSPFGQCAPTQKKTGGSEEASEDGTVPHKKKRRLLHPGAAQEDCPVHPEVDTMEYRRSDGHLHDYGPGGAL